MPQQIFRQGDVLIIQVDDLPAEELSEVERDGGRVILAYGEVTGHAHAIMEPSVKMWGTIKGDRFIKSDVPFEVGHEEHAAVKLSAGTFKIVHQREYVRGEVRLVRD